MFVSQATSVEKILDDKIVGVNVVIILYEGSRADPNMQDMIYPILYLKLKD